MADKVFDIIGSFSIPDYKTLLRDNSIQRQPNISFAKEIFGWEPVVRLEEGPTKQSLILKVYWLDTRTWVILLLLVTGDAILW